MRVRHVLKCRTVWPFEVAARDVLYPIPRWSERK